MLNIEQRQAAEWLTQVLKTRFPIETDHVLDLPQDELTPFFDCAAIIIAKSGNADMAKRLKEVRAILLRRAAQ